MSPHPSGLLEPPASLTCWRAAGGAFSRCGSPVGAPGSEIRWSPP
jgi:hypothetical protein